MNKKNNEHQIMAMLIDNPRKTLTEMSKDTGMPISTIYETIKHILKRYKLKGIFVERCPE